MNDEINFIAGKLIEALQNADMKVATAESCTGGLISSAITSVAGSSSVFERGYVTYSNDAKEELLGVARKTLEAYGAVSSEVATEMATGALEQSGADAAVAVTGIAGPGGATETKPVGMVYIAIASKPEGNFVEAFEFGNIGRQSVREKTVQEALEMLLAYAIPETD